MKLAQWRWQARWGHIEFANHGHVLPRWTSLGFGALLITFCLLGWQWQQRQALEASHAQLQAALTAASIKTSPPPVKPSVTLKTTRAPVVKVSAAQKALDRATEQLTLDWLPLLAAIESAHQTNIALLALSPNPQTARFQLKGEAKHYQALLVYVTTLQSVKGLREVHLQKHQVIESHPQLPVSFEIEGQWQP